MDEARKFPPIKALRDAYRAFGQRSNPLPWIERGPGAADHAGERPLPGQYVVDINNLISLETLHSAGTFDLDRVQPPIIFRVGQPGEIYSGIGRGEIKIERLPVIADQLGPFGSTTSDSERTMVRLDTTMIMMVVISIPGGRKDGRGIGASGWVAGAVRGGQRGRDGAGSVDRITSPAAPADRAHIACFRMASCSSSCRIASVPPVSSPDLPICSTRRVASVAGTAPR